MNLGLSLVGSLLFLAPGLACIVISHLRGPSLVRRPLLSSGSVGVLFVAPIIAALAHGLALLAFAGNHAWVNAGHPAFSTWWSLDPYPTFFAILSEAGNPTEPLSRTAIGWALVYITILSAVSVAGYRLIVRAWNFSLDLIHGKNERRKGESRLAYLLRIADKTAGSLIAAVRTKNAPYVGMAGWIGPLDSVRLAANDELISIRLIGPSVFSVNPDFPGQSDSPAYNEYDPPFETDVVHLEGGEVQSVEYFFLPEKDDEKTIELEEFQVSTEVGEHAASELEEVLPPILR